MTAPLQLLTFEALAQRIEAQRSRAQRPEIILGWDRLLLVANDLTSSGAAADDPALGGEWSLTRLRVSGYQGIAVQPHLEIEFDPTPGITVLHGPNGSGKSSIAEAIETVLHGAPRESTPAGTGGRAPLWERVHCGRDADEAAVDLELLRGADHLALRCRLDEAGAVIESSAWLRTNGCTRPIDLSTTTWRSALAGHRPVFEYSAIERRVQLAKDLQQFLENLLAFGGCFDTFEREIEWRSGASKDAKVEWSRALKEAQRQVCAVDLERSTPGEPLLPEIAWPEIGDEPETWLADAGISVGGDAMPEITSQHHERLKAAAGTALGALSDLEAAETSLRARLATSLKQLHSAARGIPEKGDHCPVCAANDAGWFDTLTHSLNSFPDLAAVISSFQTALRGLRDTVDRDLGAVRSVLSSGTNTNHAPSLGDQPDQLAAILEQHGLGPVPEVRAATQALCTWLTSDACGAAVEQARLESDRLRQWARARRASVDDFVTVWRKTRSLAVDSAEWESANKRLRDLKQKLREERSASLQELTGERVQRLLSDAGLVVKSMTVQGTKASLEIVDKTGKPMTLAMLSAGQRNALLLSPLLVASAGGGPFGFLVLDDPVHAFDQLRVDILSAILHDMARERRVVIFTHDERLREHLLAHDVNCDSRAVARDPLTGVVTVAVQGQMWEALLADARGALKLVNAQPAGVAVTPSDLVRGLCRQALDNALRQFVLQRCLRNGHDPTSHLDALDQANTTKERMATARKTLAADREPGQPLDEARGFIEPYLDDWNRAAHGNPPESAVDNSEVDAAQRACKILLERML